MMVNDRMPEYTVERAGKILNRYKKALNGSRVLVLGAAFIANGAVDLFIEWYARDSAKQADLMARPR